MIGISAAPGRNHPSDLTLLLQKMKYLLESIVTCRLAAAIFAACLISTASFAQQSPSSSEKPETSCTTGSAATSGHGEEKTHNSMAVGKSAVLPDAGGANSAAPTVQSGDKPLIVRKECPPDSKPRS